MKKRLFAILLALMLTLLPVMTLEAAADDGQSLGTLRQTCPKCKKANQDLKIIGYIWKNEGFQVNEKQHWLHVLCPSCHEKGYLAGDDHCGGTETPTCTTGKTCEKCHGEYGILGHIWSEWTSNGDGTHSRICQRDTTHVEIENCNGTATCQAPAKCTVCGAERGEKSDHSFSVSWDCNTEQHWHYCLTKGCDAKSDVGYHNINDNHYCPTCYTSPIPCMDTDNDHKCDGCGKTISDHTGGTANCHTKAVCDICKQEYGDVNTTNHDGGTEIKNAKAATCTEKGYTGDTYCKGCNAKLSDGTDIPALGHDWAEATCTAPKTCKVCNATEGDATGHKLTHVPAKNPTTFVAGNIEYWYCTVCGKYFRDAAATQEITKEATVTHKESTPIQDNKTVKSSKTGDAGVMLYAGMAVLSLTGCAWLRRKEK